MGGGLGPEAQVERRAHGSHERKWGQKWIVLNSLGSRDRGWTADDSRALGTSKPSFLPSS